MACNWLKKWVKKWISGQIRGQGTFSRYRKSLETTDFKAFQLVRETGLEPASHC